MINPVLPESIARPFESRFSGLQQCFLVLRILRYTRYVWDKLVLRLCISQINAFLVAAPAALAIRLVDEAFAQHDMALFVQLCAIIAVAIFLRKVLEFVDESMKVYSIARVGMQLRTDIVKHILSLSARFYGSRPIGEHMYRCIYDSSDVQMIVTDLLPRGIMNLQRILALLLMLASIQRWIVPVCAVYLVLFFMAKHAVASRMRAADRHEKRETQRVDAITRELYAAFKLIKGYNLENMARRWYWNQVAKRIRWAFRKLAWWSLDDALNQPVIGLAFPVLLLALNWIAGRQVLDSGSSAVTIGGYAAIAIAVEQLALPVQDIIALFQETRWRLVPTERMMDTFDAQPDILDAPDACAATSSRGHIEFRNVSFAYDAVPVLKNVSFEVRPGEKVAIAGPVGAGKSTLIRLLLRMADPGEGEILLDGIDIRKIEQKSLRQLFGVVPQEIHLFSESVADNIRRAVPGAAQARVEEAARIARADEFIEAFPDGWDEPLRAGVSLSGGQRQRLCLARALLKDAPVLLLDEATSALDSLTEGAVVEAVDRQYAKRTRLVVAHNMLNTQTADRIYVIDAGEVVESGTHEELLRKQGKYCQLWRD